MTQSDWLVLTYRSQDPVRIAEVEQILDSRLRDYVRAKYRLEKNIGSLRGWVLAGLPTGVHYGRGIDKAILQYMGWKITMLSVRKDMRCKASTAMQYKRIAYERLDALHDLAMQTLQPLYARSATMVRELEA